jgi:hypothetical protein
MNLSAVRQATTKNYLKEIDNGKKVFGDVSRPDLGVIVFSFSDYRTTTAWAKTASRHRAEVRFEN